MSHSINPSAPSSLSASCTGTGRAASLCLSSNLVPAAGRDRYAVLMRDPLGAQAAGSLMGMAVHSLKGLFHVSRMLRASNAYTMANAAPEPVVLVG